MKHFRLLLPLLVLALVLSGCGSSSEEPYSYTFTRNDQVKTITVNPAQRTILDGTDVYTYEISSSGSGTSYVIDYPNGAVFHWTSSGNGGAGGWSEGYEDQAYISGNILVWALEENQPREKIGNLLLSLLITAAGAWQLLSPETAIYVSKGWRFKNAEPTEGYVLATRIGGGVLVIIGLACCFL